MPLARFLTCLAALALVVATFAQGQAKSRPSPDGLQAIVICAGEVSATIFVDGDGQPVDPATCSPELCPDCLRVQTFALPADALSLAVPARARSRTIAMSENPLRHRRQRMAMARAPPAGG